MIMRSVGCNIFSVITSRLESSVVIRPPRSLGNDAFDIYSCSTSVPDALVVCSLFYWAWWLTLSLLLSSMADSVTTAIYPPDSTHEHDWSDSRYDLTAAQRAAQSQIFKRLRWSLTVKEQVEAQWQSFGDKVDVSSLEDITFLPTCGLFITQKASFQSREGFRTKEGMTYF